MQLLTLAGSLILLASYSVTIHGAENLGPCTKAKLTGSDQKVGKYIPQCTEYGYFKPIQCHGSTGECWCVNPDDGKTVPGTSVYHGSEVIKCPMCHLKRAEALRVDGMVGGYVPQCDENGHFTPKQQYGSIGHSWCVDPQTGNEIDGTRRKAPEQANNCDDLMEKTHPSSNVQFVKDTKGPCQEIQPHQMKLGMFSHKCTEKGYFQTEQHDSSTGYKWCVNPKNGKEIPGTRRGPKEDKPKCGACFMEIQDKLSTKRLLGMELPKCNEVTGDYQPLQFREGYRYCVNPQSGALVGKIYPPSDNTALKCDQLI